MLISKLNLNSTCPCCDHSLIPIAMGCTNCNAEIKGPISLHPLMKLDSDMLHFLMVFIHCGGKISDMEKALGISYPTVKTKMLKLQELILQKPEVRAECSALNNEATTKSTPSKQDLQIIDILKKIDTGEVDYSTALKTIKNIKRKGTL